MLVLNRIVCNLYCVSELFLIKFWYLSKLRRNSFVLKMLFWSIGGKYSIRRWRQMFRLTAKNFFCGMVHSGESTVLWSECVRSRILIPGVSGTEILFTQHSSYEKKSNIYKQKEIWLWHLNNRRLTKSFYGNSVISIELLSFEFHKDTLPIEKIFELEIYCFEFLIQSLITRSITCNTHSKIEEEI